ncbi:Transcriptional regulator, TetR family [Leptospirillum ferriphilum]|jgi:AcrR family transcriptional regulator|uniref:Transcriptional regulator, TetR family n=2 Tax=Leptospirillum TaxID=179 RepID=A0A094YIR9_9BACT|nr:TetR/AcrR family transcriptional regulator [Leptospirillum ferriphilum]EDZ39200.1 MAG: Putative transcriptional regulator, TetR family [Leptospirillum sp. Group II '5-way CG']KGA93066.1 Transcriptional regulator, TetR family [Leptospirillum ferriphilum]
MVARKMTLDGRSQDRIERIEQNMKKKLALKKTDMVLDKSDFEEARNHIVERAANLFAGRRYDQVTLDDLIAILGIGKGTLYRYFSNKAELYSRIVEVGHENLLALLGEIHEREDLEPTKKLHEMSFSMAHFLRIHQDIYTVMAIEEPKERFCRSDKMIRYRTERIRMIASIIEKGQAEGVFRADFDPWLFAQSLIGALWVEAIFPFLLEGEIKKELRTEEIVSLFLRGIGMNPGVSG